MVRMRAMAGLKICFDTKLIDNVVESFAIFADNPYKNDASTNPLLNQPIELRLISFRAMEHDLFRETIAAGHEV